MGRRKPDIAVLEAKIGHGFADPELLAQALTHVSAAGGAYAKSYQRLEFLGDRVLGLAVADMLYATFPKASEGDLSRRLSELVRKETCADVAASWGIGPYLRLGGGEVQSGVRKNRSVLADACEAVLGAVFLDGGYPAARGVVERAFSERMKAFQKPPSNPKAALQEWTLGRGLGTPLYETVEQFGPHHAPRFRIAVRIEGFEAAMGQGSSKRAAEQDAAQNLLVREEIWTAADAAEVGTASDAAAGIGVGGEPGTEGRLQKLTAETAHPAGGGGTDDRADDARTGN
jgi:ribonuclease III